MKKKIINIVLLAATVAMTGCNDWLDMSPTNKVSEKIVWSDVNYVTQYVNGFYPYISRYGAFESNGCCSQSECSGCRPVTEGYQYRIEIYGKSGSYHCRISE